MKTAINPKSHLPYQVYLIKMEYFWSIILNAFGTVLK